MASPVLVKTFAIMGASVCYVGLMGGLVLGFGAVQALLFRRAKEVDYDH